MMKLAEVWIYEDLVDLINILKFQKEKQQYEGIPCIHDIDFDSEEEVERYEKARRDATKDINDFVLSKDKND